MVLLPRLSPNHREGKHAPPAGSNSTPSGSSRQHHTFLTQGRQAGYRSRNRAKTDSRISDYCRKHCCSRDRGQLTFSTCTTGTGLKGGEPTRVWRLAHLTSVSKAEGPLVRSKRVGGAAALRGLWREGRATTKWHAAHRPDPTQMQHLNSMASML